MGRLVGYVTNTPTPEYGRLLTYLPGGHQYREQANRLLMPPPALIPPQLTPVQIAQVAAVQAVQVVIEQAIQAAVGAAVPV